MNNVFCFIPLVFGAKLEFKDIVSLLVFKTLFNILYRYCKLTKASLYREENV